MIDVALHIGQEKTASTRIQAHLCAVRAALRGRGILYSSAFGDDKARYLLDALLGDRRLDAAGTDAARRAFAGEMLGAWTRLVLSSENLFRAKREQIEPLSEFLAGHGGRPTIYCYVRRPDDHLASLYQQAVRGGSQLLKLEEFAAKFVKGRYYKYHEKLSVWVDVFGRASVKVRLFHPDLIRDPVDHFLNWIGVPTYIRPDPPLSKRSLNEGYDAVSVELLRLLSLQRERFSGAYDDASFRWVQDRLLDFNTSDKLRLAPDQARAVLLHCRADHERLAAEFLTDDEKHLLLEAPPIPASQAPVDGSDVAARIREVLGSAPLSTKPRRVIGQPDTSPRTIGGVPDPPIRSGRAVELEPGAPPPVNALAEQPPVSAHETARDAGSAGGVLLTRLLDVLEDLDGEKQSGCAAETSAGKSAMAAAVTMTAGTTSESNA
jgi:hypothetical protein